MANTAMKSSSARPSSTPAPLQNPPTNPRGIPSFPFMTAVTEYIKTPADVAPTLDRFQEMIQKYNFMLGNVEARIRGYKEKIPEMKSTLETIRFLARKRKRAAAVIKRKKQESSSRSGGETQGRGPDGDFEVSDQDETSSSSTSNTEIQTTFQLNPTLYAHATIPLVSSRSHDTDTDSLDGLTTVDQPQTLDEVYLWLGANIMVAYPLAEAESLLSEKLGKTQHSLDTSEEDVAFLREQITGLEVAVARVWNWDVAEKRKRKDP